MVAFSLLWKRCPSIVMKTVSESDLAKSRKQVNKL